MYHTNTTVAYPAVLASSLLEVVPLTVGVGVAAWAASATPVLGSEERCSPVAACALVATEARARCI